MHKTKNILSFFKILIPLICLEISPIHGMEITQKTGSTSITSNDEVEIYKKMVNNGLKFMFDKHQKDWEVLNTEAAQYWRDPTTILAKTVENQISDIYNYLSAIFLNNSNAVSQLMANYFNHQCNSLYEHFLDNQGKTYSFFRSFPTEYTATLAYETKAIEMKIYLEENFHSLYSIDHQRARLIEDLKQKNAGGAASNNAPQKRIIRKAPPRINKSIHATSGTKGFVPKNVPHKKTDGNKTKVVITERKSMGPLLEEIRNGRYRLRPANVSVQHHRMETETLEQILKNGLDLIHRGNFGENTLLMEKDDDVW